MDINMQASVLGEDPERGGALTKISIFHGGKIPVESATELLTKLKHAMHKHGYEIVRGSSTGSFRPDQDGERVLESSFSGNCLAIMLTHNNVNLPEDKLKSDMNAALAKIDFVVPENTRAR